MAFLSGLIGSYSSAMLGKQKAEFEQKQKDKELHIKALQYVFDSPSATSEEKDRAAQEIEEITGGGGKGKKEGKISFRDVMGRLTGHISSSQGQPQQAPQGQQPPPKQAAPSLGIPPIPPNKDSGGAGGAPIPSGGGAPGGSPLSLGAPPAPPKQSRAQILGQEELEKKKPELDYAAEQRKTEDETIHKQKMEEISANLRNKFIPQIATDGSMYVINGESGEAKQVVDKDGKPIAVNQKGGSTASLGKPALVDGVPYGITARDSKGQITVLTPKSPEWNKSLQDKLDEAFAAADKSQKQKIEAAEVIATSRAMAYNLSREYGVIDTDTGSLVMVNPAVINASPGKYAPAAGGQQAMQRKAVIGDINFNVKNVSDALSSLQNGFDAKARGQIALALRATDPRSALGSFLTSEVAESLTPDQVDYVTALASLSENAMALRSVAGMGQGSDDLRAAIVRAIPGAGTPSKEYGQRQLQLFQGTVDRLAKGIPNLGNNGSGGGTSKYSRTATDANGNQVGWDGTKWVPIPKPKQ